jgi:hypothetical protein
MYTLVPWLLPGGTATWILSGTVTGILSGTVTGILSGTVTGILSGTVTGTRPCSCRSPNPPTGNWSYESVRCCNSLHAQTRIFETLIGCIPGCLPFWPPRGFEKWRCEGAQASRLPAHDEAESLPVPSHVVGVPLVLSIALLTHNNARNVPESRPRPKNGQPVSPASTYITQRLGTATLLQSLIHLLTCARAGDGVP